MNEPVVPETRGTMLVHIWPLEPGHGIEIDRLPVVAWRISGGRAEPITCEESRGQVWCLEIPIGTRVRYVFPDDCSYDSLGDVIEEVRIRLAALKEKKS